MSGPVPSLGFDPGAMGAIALVHAGRVHVFDAPMRLDRRGKSKKPVTDGPRLLALLRFLSDVYPTTQGYIEKVWGVKGQGAATGAALGHARAWLEAAFLASFGREPFLVSPQRWKADLGLFKQPKGASVELAIRLWPADANEFRSIRGQRTQAQCEGRAEAALIAYHGAGGRV